MSNASDFLIEDGILKKYTGPGGDVVVPEGVMSIGGSAFSFCSKLISVTLPRGVTDIGRNAFYWSGNLISVTLPEGVINIGDEAFSRCEKLQNITIPKNVTSLGNGAFSSCKNITDIKIPEGVTKILDRTFSDCCKLRNVSIPDSVTFIGRGAFSGCSELTELKLPEKLTLIADNAFSNCKSLKSLTLPENVQTVSPGAFNDCEALESLTILNPDLKFERGVFHIHTFMYKLPEKLAVNAESFWRCIPTFDAPAYLLRENTWRSLSTESKAELFFTRQGKSLEEGYRYCVTPEDADAIGNALLGILSEKPSAKDCGLVHTFFTLLHEKASASTMKALFDKLKTIKSGAKTVAKIEADPVLMQAIGKSVESDVSLPPAEKKITEMLLTGKKSIAELESMLQDCYAIKFRNLPDLRYTDGTAASPVVMAWLLLATSLVCYEQLGISPEAKEVLAYVDPSSLQKALLRLSDDYLGIPGNSKCMYLAFPICKYADEETIAELVRRAPKWRSSVSGNDAPPLATFRRAIQFREDRIAMLFAEKFGDLKRYAELRGMTEDDVRDRYLSDVGLASDGTKQYDLGTSVVTAVMQPDFSFLVQLPNGKTAKSLPKKNADPEMYEAANKDFDELKKSAKKILKNRFSSLFNDFLSGRERAAKDWLASYETNPLLRHCATLVVWKQGKNTFILGKNGAIDSAEQPYTITDEPIGVAHPMEMEGSDVVAWQKYFTAHGFKQPFAQVWEPVREAKKIKPDRYAGCMIPYYRFMNQEKHGITVEDYDFHNDIEIGFEGCEAVIERIDQRRHEISPEDRFEVTSFGFKLYTRQVNHIVAYLDRITVWDRVKKDDISVMDLMDTFTLAQIMEFIAAAQEANATNVLAALLDYKNTHFADFDPMTEFTLDW